MTNNACLDYLAGFFDAEGCVYFSSNGKQQQIMYSVGQSDPAVLYLFKLAFGGTVRKRAEATDKHQEQWIWIKVCTRSDKFCPTMIDRTVIKHRQIKLAMKFSESLRVVGPGGRDRLTDSVIRERDSIRRMLKEAKGKEFDCEDVVVPEMPIEYWAGLFDGDGSAGTNKNKRCFYPRALIYSSYVPVLESAKRQFSGIVLECKNQRARRWRVFNKSAEVFLRLVEPHVIVKANVVRGVLALKDFAVSSRKSMVCDARGMNRKFTDSVILEMDSMANHIRELNRFGPKRKVA
jgi:hypothetical protein